MHENTKNNSIPKPNTEVQYNWVDIRDGFNASCKELRLGELVHDNLFGLFEAMSAIEIMDPKMDAGMVCNKTRKVHQLPSAIATGKIKVRDFAADEILGIMNELTACFCTWLGGHSLVQTVFTCLYCHNPAVIEDVVLKAFCISTLKMIDIIRSICSKAKVFEEEDFQPLTYGFKLACDVTELRASGMLREADEEISKKIKTCQSNSEISQKEIDECNAIKQRLKFWRFIYNALLTFEKQEYNDIGKCKEQLNAARELLKDISTTQQLGVKPDPEKEYHVLGFDELVNQRLLLPSFPRQCAILQQDTIWSYFDDLIGRLLHTCSVTECENLHIILEFLSEFSKKASCVLSRSVLQLIVYHPSGRVLGKHQMAEMIREAIKLFNAAPSVADMSPLTSTEAKSLVNNFLTSAVKPIVGLIEAYGHNRARQREKLALLLDDFGALQIEADTADQELHQLLKGIDAKREHLACFESWVLFHSLSIMIQHTFLGFELDLFNSHEFHYVYWYLDYLFGWANNCLHRAETLLNKQEQFIDKKCGKKEKKRKKEILTVCSDQIKERKSLRLIFNGMKELSLGNIKAYEGFDKLGKIKRPEIFFDNEKIRFEHRFASFQSVDTHKSTQYHDYKRVVNQTLLSTTDNPFPQSMLHFQKAIEILQYVEQFDVEGESLMKVAKTNFIVMRLASSGHTSAKDARWVFNCHQSYPFIKLS